MPLLWLRYKVLWGGVSPKLRFSPYYPPYHPRHNSCGLQPRPTPPAAGLPPSLPSAHPTGATPGGGSEGGGAPSSRGPKATPRARTAGPGAGARRATRPRCWSRKRSVSARCSGSVGGSSTGPTGPAASADNTTKQGELGSSAPAPPSPGFSTRLTPQGTTGLGSGLQGHEGCRQRQQETLDAISQGC